VFLVAAALLVAAVVVSVVVRHRPSDPGPPPAFHEGLGIVGSVVPVPVGSTYLTDVAIDLPDVSITSATPRVAPDSAPVAASVVACEPNRPDDGIASDADIDSACSTVQRVDGLDLSTLSPDAHLVLVVAPLAKGSVAIDGVRVAYRMDGRRHVQTVGMRVTLPAS
jgi:hypothetical protein